MGKIETLRSCASLQLLAENAVHLHLLQKAVARAGALDEGQGPDGDGEDLREWIEAGGEVRQLPLPGLHCTELVTPRGAYRVFPGDHEDEHWVVEALLGRSLETSELPRPFISDCGALTDAVLGISETIAARISARRNTEPEHRPGEAVVVPERETLQRLGQSLQFSAAELFEIAGEAGIGLLPRMIGKAEDLEGLDAEARERRLRSRPLLETGGVVTIAAPTDLVAALRHQIVLLSIAHDVREPLAQYFLLETGRHVVESLERLGMTIFKAAPIDEDPGFDRLEVLCLSDLDKELHLIVLSDDLEDYDEEDPLSVWKGGPDTESLEARLQEVSEARFSHAGPPNDILHLIVAQGMGRPIERVVDPAGELRDLRLVLSASELEAIARSESADPMLFWDFSRDVAELRRHVALLPASQLEEWAYWKRRHRSFSELLLEIGEQGCSGVIVGEARMMKIDFAFSHDPHGAKGPDGRYVRVLNYLEDERVPIAQADAAPIGTAQLLVEGLPFEFWVLPRDPPKEEAIYEHLQWIELIAYWIWQMAPALGPLLEELTAPEPLSIALVMTENDAVAEPWRVSAVAERKVLVEIAPDGTMALSGQTNLGERRLMRAVLDALNALASNESRKVPLSEEELKRCIEVQMSPPTKRKLVPIFHVDPGYERPSYPERPVSDAASWRLRQEAGFEAAQRLGLGAGPVASEQIHPLLNAAVGALYGRLESFVASLDPNFLVEWLISLNERLLHEETLVPSQLAIAAGAFGNESAFARRPVGAAPDLATASVASRFLIEYVAARPPQGLRPVSYEVYDRLLAASSLITGFGISSDLIVEGLAEVTAVLLPSGELFDDRGSFSTGMSRFYDVSRTSEASRAGAWFAEHLAQAESFGGGQENDYAELFGERDAAMEAETGHGFSELIQALIVLSNQPGIGGGASRMPRTEAVSQLREECGWSEEKASSVLDHFSLGSRPEFTIPPEGFENRDIWPWRFNRRLSYLRRPLVERVGTSGETELIFGARNLYNATLYLEMLLSHGSFEARSQEMKDYMSRAQKRESDGFKEAVAAAYEGQGRVVKPDLHKVGGKRLGDNERNDLGDVDVLVAEPACRTLLCVEAKRLAGALAPHQLRNQIDRSFGEGGKKPSHAHKHIRRIARIRELKAQVLADLGIDDPGDGWRVEGIIVTDVDVLAPFIAQVPLPVRSFEQISSALADGRLY